MSEQTAFAAVIGILVAFTITAAFACLISCNKKFTVVGRTERSARK